MSEVWLAIELAVKESDSTHSASNKWADRGSVAKVPASVYSDLGGIVPC